MRQNTLILWAKYLTGRNALRHLEGIMYFHLTAATLVIALLLAGGTVVFYRMFLFLMNQPLFGPPLMDRLVGIIFLAFFSMLIFSNLIITLSTSYISKEVDFLMGQPIPYPAIFRQKLLESVVYSSWAFVILSLPFFVAFGMSRGVGWTFYPLVALLIVPFLLVPAAIGSIVTMLITALLPARRTRTMIVVLAAVSILIAITMARFMNIRGMFLEAETGDFGNIMSFLEFGSSPLLPSSWMMEGILALAPGWQGGPNYGGYFYWLAMLGATALFLIHVSEWLVPSLYYRGWALTKDSSSRGEVNRSRFALFNVVDRMLSVFPVHIRALLSKDLKTFWRDPSQWTQLVILFGLMVIYIANLRSAQNYSGAVVDLVTDWRAILAFFNLGATCFILSILTTRFIFPMLSLEGRQFWTIGLAPMKRTTIVWQKYVLCLCAALVMALSILLMSNWVLRIEPALQYISIACTIVMSFGLTSLSIGLGALLPNFREDNPARIANGIGGTANALLSLIYVACTVGMLGMPMHLYYREQLFGMPLWQRWWVPYVMLFVAIQVVTVFLPMYLGLRKWKRLEF